MTRLACWGKKSLSRTEGYARRTLSILAPKLFPQRAYFDSLNFLSGADWSANSANHLHLWLVRVATSTRRRHSVS